MNTINRIVSLDQLNQVVIPDSSRVYRPIGHGDLDNRIKEAITKNNFELASTKYLAAREGKQAVGMYNINFDNNPDYGIKIIFQNSYDKSLTVKLAVGVEVFVCTNGCVRGDMGSYKHKHMGDVQELTPQTIEEYIKSAGDTFFKIIANKQKMKEIEITKRTCAELLGRMFIEEGAITANQLGIIKKEIEIPTFDYGVSGSLLNLYENTTFSLRNAHPQYWLSQHEKVNSFLTKEYAI